jgi:hypothetical protein
MVLNATSTIFHAYCGAQFYLQWVTRLTPPAFRHNLPPHHTSRRRYQLMYLVVLFLVVVLLCVFTLWFSLRFRMKTRLTPPAFSEVRVFRSLALCVCFVDRCLSFCSFSFCHCVVCSSSTCHFWQPIWFLQTFNFWLFFLSQIWKRYDN